MLQPRLLHPQHLDGICSGLTLYRLPLDKTPLGLVCIQNPDPQKFQEVRERGLASFSVLKKTESQTWGRNGEKKSQRILVVFQSTEIGKSSLSHFLKFFQDQGSGYSLREGIPEKNLLLC